MVKIYLTSYQILFLILWNQFDFDHWVVNKILIGIFEFLSFFFIIKKKFHGGERILFLFVFIFGIILIWNMHVPEEVNKQRSPNKFFAIQRDNIDVKY